VRSRPWLLALGVILWATYLSFTVGRWTLFLTIPLVIAGGAPLLRKIPPLVQEGPRTAPTWLRRKLLARDRGRCRYCGVDVHYEVDCPNAPIGCGCDYHADHVQAWANEGSTVEANMVASCRWCNVHKGAMPVEEFVAWLWSPEGRAALAERFASAPF
jgi:5-methylcytosine-specific restriction endonuclease McrA